MLSINFVEGALITVGYDHSVRVYDESMTEIHVFNAEAIPRSLDRDGDTYLVGAKDGSIKEHKVGDKTTLMDGHCEGEVWGLALTEENIISCGDDTQVVVLDYKATKSRERAP